MIKLESLIYEVKSLVNEEDKKSFKDLDTYLKIAMESYVNKVVVKERYCEFFIKAIPVSDFLAVLPKHEKIIQISGSNTMKQDYAYTGMLREDVVAWMRQSPTGDCIYTVYKNCGTCGKDDCNEHEILMNANLFSKDLGRGGTYNLIKTDYDRTHYGFGEDAHGCKTSLINNKFYLMHPTESKQFGIQQQYIEECINYKIIPNEYMGTTWDYKIQFDSNTQKNVIKTNFKEGVILLSYYANYYDEEGFRMVPDLHFLPDAIKNYSLMKVYEKLKNDYKSNDYRATYNDYVQDFRVSNEGAIGELSEVPLNELITIIARNKWHSKLDKNYHSLTQSDYPDYFNMAYDKSFGY